MNRRCIAVWSVHTAGICLLVFGVAVGIVSAMILISAVRGGQAPIPVSAWCHQLPARSFHYEGQIFPLCARCLGAHAGIILGLLASRWSISIRHCTLQVGLALVWVGVIDKSVFLSLGVDSSNMVRVIAGIAAGGGVSLVMVGLASKCLAFDR